MNNYLLGNTRVVLTVTIVTLVSAALILFLIVPEVRTVTKIAADIGSDRQKSADIAAEVKSYEDSYAELNRVPGGRETFEQMFPTRENAVVLIQGLEDATAKAGIEESLKLTDRLELSANRAAEKSKLPLAKNFAKIEEIPYSLELTATYRQILDFFLNLENQPFISEVGKFSAAADAGSDKESEIVRNTGTAAVKIEGSIFVKAE